MHAPSSELPVPSHAIGADERRPPVIPAWRRVRRVALGATVIALIPAAVSYLSAITGAYNVGVGIESVEWLRQHGANGLVSQVENWYYTLTAPAKGGPALRALPRAGLPAAVLRARLHVYRPPRVRPVIRPALPGEGVWHPSMASAGIDPPVLLTTFRSEVEYPRLVAGVAWINARRTWFAYVPGTQEPPVSLPHRGLSEVPPSQRHGLVATFNGGFPIFGGSQGLAIGGHTYRQMVDGIGTLVQYQNGKVDLISWHGGATVGPEIAFAKQNLPLIINHGLKNPNLGDGPEWGWTVKNAIRVWRSGVGIDHHGNLLYAAANNQTVSTLADILLRAGAVRALELDINEEWTSFITYRYPGAREPSNLLPDMNRSRFRYLTPDDRDFFAIYRR